MISPEKMFIGKQPIVDVDGKTFAYEILFRAGDKNGAFVNDNKFATARVLVNTLNNLGIQNLLEDCRGFINVDEKIILDDVVEMIPSDKFVLEILETTKIDDLLIERVKHLQKKGYIFAIDDMDLTDKMIEEFRNLYTYSY